MNGKSTEKIQPQLERVIHELSQSETAADYGKETYAAVDLGSNSFHMVISRYEHGEFTVLDRQREVVRLAGGLDETKRLSEEVADRAINTLSKFGQLLRSIPPKNVRVVGTNALRQMQQKQHFLDAAEKALGHNIEIIAGREEARLIYLGVSKWSEMGKESRLVIDIGGGSTEIIVGRDEKPQARESLEVGCVVLTRQFFADGKLSKKRFQKAKLAAELAIQPVVEQFRIQGWNHVIGCSGTMKSLSQVLISNGWSVDGIQNEALNRLLNTAIEAGHIDHLDLPGLTRDRKPVFAGGLAILLALFELFDIQDMSVSEISLREGVLYDLVGRSTSQDIRNITVTAMLNRWSVDPNHGEKVSKTALSIYQQVCDAWNIQDSLYKKCLGWAAQLHELGLHVSHDGYHKHGAYLLAKADMAGFARRDQLLLSALVQGHRRKFPIYQFEQLPSALVTPAKRIAVILRLAVLLHRGRHANKIPELLVSVDAQDFILNFKNNWLLDNPLTLADLNQEQTWLKAIGVNLKFN